MLSVFILFNDEVTLLTDQMSWEWVIRLDFSLQYPLSCNILALIITALPVCVANKRMWLLSVMYAVRLWFELKTVFFFTLLFDLIYLLCLIDVKWQAFN